LLDAFGDEHHRLVPDFGEELGFDEFVSSFHSPLHHEFLDAGPDEFRGVFNAFPGFRGPFDLIFFRVWMINFFSHDIWGWQDQALVYLLDYINYERISNNSEKT